MENPFSPRQMEILQLMSEGYSTQKIADKLGISLKTVTTHKSRIYMELRRYGVKNKKDLVEYATLKHLISSAEN